MDVELEDEPAAPLVEAWKRHARQILEALDWEREELAWRDFDGGVSLAISAPIDALYAATEVNEWALEAALAELDGRPEPRLGPATARLQMAIQEESNPALIGLARAAAERDVALLADDQVVSVGLGRGSRSWPVDALPTVEQVPWDDIHDIPVVLVTGTNGKTTTVRLLASIVNASGRTAGTTSTDGIVVGEERVDSGDWSGPGGARTLLRDGRVEVGILECARGGMLRRGLGVERAQLAIITNVAADHLGEWGIDDLDALTEAKFIVARAARTLVLNADDERVVERARQCAQPITWFTTRHDHPMLIPGRSAGAVWASAGSITFRIGCIWEPLMPIEEIPIAHGGAARHNVSNALAAVGAGFALTSEAESIRAGLSGMVQNPGRLERFDLGGLRVVVDFAHNPHGMEALLQMAHSFRPRRLLVTLGQAGDRTDEEIAELARCVARARPDRVLVKELQKYLRGREPGTVPRLLEAGLTEAGMPAASVERCESEMAAVRSALAWAESGDLLLLITLAERSAVLTYLERMREKGWAPGDRVPTGPPR